MGRSSLMVVTRSWSTWLLTTTRHHRRLCLSSFSHIWASSRRYPLSKPGNHPCLTATPSYLAHIPCLPDYSSSGLVTNKHRIHRLQLRMNRYAVVFLELQETEEISRLWGGSRSESGAGFDSFIAYVAAATWKTTKCTKVDVALYINRSKIPSPTNGNGELQQRLYDGICENIKHVNVFEHVFADK